MFKNIQPGDIVEFNYESKTEKKLSDKKESKVCTVQLTSDAVEQLRLNLVANSEEKLRWFKEASVTVSELSALQKNLEELKQQRPGRNKTEAELVVEDKIKETKNKLKGNKKSIQQLTSFDAATIFFIRSYVFENMSEGKDVKAMYIGPSYTTTGKLRYSWYKLSEEKSSKSFFGNPYIIEQKI